MLTNHQNFDVNSELDPWLLISHYLEVADRLLRTRVESSLINVQVDTTHGSATKNSVTEARESFDLLGGELRRIRVAVMDAAPVMDSWHIGVAIGISFGRDASKCEISVAGPDDIAVVGLAESLQGEISRWTDEAQARLSPVVLAGEEASGVASPVEGTRKSVARRRVSLSDSQEFDYVRLPLWMLTQIEDELRRLGDVRIRGEDFKSVSSTEEFEGLAFKVVPEFRIEAPKDAVWEGVRARFTNRNVVLTCNGDSDRARAVYSMVGEILAASQSRRIPRLRAVSGVITLATGGLYLGWVARESAGAGHPRTSSPLAALFVISAVLYFLAIVVFNVAGLIGRRPRVGAVGNRWWGANRDGLVISLLGALASVLFLALLALLGIRH